MWILWSAGADDIGFARTRKEMRCRFYRSLLPVKSMTMAMKNQAEEGFTATSMLASSESPGHDL